MSLGTCPSCRLGEINYEVKKIQGKSTKLYSCSRGKVATEDGEVWEQVGDCGFRIFGNSLKIWGKNSLSSTEVRRLIAGNEVVVHLYSFNKKVKYKKYLELSLKYGVSVIWDIDIDEEEMELDKHIDKDVKKIIIKK